MFSEDYMPAASETFSHVLSVPKYYVCPAPANDLVLLKEFKNSRILQNFALVGLVMEPSKRMHKKAF